MMRKMIITFGTLLLLFTAAAYAQSPNGVNYQLVVRDGSGNVLSSRAVNIRFALRQGSAAGTVVFSENHSATSSSLGLVNLVLGNGTATTGSLASVNWAAGPYFLETLIDQNGGSSYTSMGIQQLMSVPYALYAQNGFNNGTANNQMTYWNGSVWANLPAPASQGSSLAYCDGNLTWVSGGVCPEVSSLDCGSITNIGTLTSGTAAIGVSSSVPYTGGNGEAYSAQSVSSTGVTGLAASLAAGTLANGSGSLTYTITGTAISSGTATFALRLGGQICSLNRIVNASGYAAGSIFCNGPTTVVNVTNPATGKIWMDRNLGATQVATSSTDSDSYGDLYQWGRRSDGHQCRSSSTTTTLSSTEQPAHGEFILYGIQPWNWFSFENTNLWQGISGVNNPCPIGYRLPTYVELNDEASSWPSYDANGAFASPLKWPLPGARDFSNGVLNSVGSVGYYWSSTSTTTMASPSYTITNCLHFSRSTVLGFNWNYRTSGFSVRCIKN